MIYYDSHKNKFIPLDIKDIDFKYTTNNNISTRQLSKECELVIRFDYSELEHFKEWINDSDQRMVRKYVSEYKRDIFISSDEKDTSLTNNQTKIFKQDSKFSNCYLASINTHDNYFEITLYCDYYNIGGVYPELKAIYRDMKIDLILSK
jgi:hypothetical protein